MVGMANDCLKGLEMDPSLLGLIGMRRRLPILEPVLPDSAVGQFCSRETLLR